jgi:TRAP-type C4-dicarboxylate transport system permease large subunit
VGLPVYRCFDWRRLMPMLTETAALSGAILMIIGTATAMACKVRPDAGMRPIIGYMIALLIGIVIIASVSWISTGFLR